MLLKYNRNYVISDADNDGGTKSEHGLEKQEEPQQQTRVKKK